MAPHRPDHDETLEALADRLRRLPPPPVPPGLERLLLAAIPPTPRARIRPTRFRIAAAVLLATAATALLAVRLPQREPSPPAVVSPPADEPATLWRYEQALRGPDADPAVVLNQVGTPFEWPVTGSVLLADERREAPQ